jgi:hypothetical protein
MHGAPKPPRKPETPAEKAVAAHAALASAGMKIGKALHKALFGKKEKKP